MYVPIIQSSSRATNAAIMVQNRLQNGDPRLGVAYEMTGASCLSAKPVFPEDSLRGGSIAAPGFMSGYRGGVWIGVLWNGNAGKVFVAWASQPPGGACRAQFPWPEDAPQHGGRRSRIPSPVAL